MRRALREADLATIQLELRCDPTVVNTTDEDGNTPLHLAAQAEDTAESAEFMKFLLDHGGPYDINPRLRQRRHRQGPRNFGGGPECGPFSGSVQETAAVLRG
jgi:ankyrin repeat protein